MTRPAPDLLAEIVAHKRTEIARRAAACPAAELEARLQDAPPPRGFVAALNVPRPIHLIAEVKRASPSAGMIRAGADPVSVARTYEAHGASCVSVLTDERYFQGTLDDLIRVREAIGLPVLRKDFVIDRYQLVEARAAGADAVLLIAECLDDCRLRDLYFHAGELGLDVLIEIYDPENLDRVLKLDPDLIGVNNRNLRTMVTDLEHSLALRPRVPAGTRFVSESGVRTHADVERLIAAGVDAMLVGESLMKAQDIGAAVDALLGRTSPGK